MMFYEYHRSVGVEYLRVSDTPAREFDFPLHLHQSFELVCVEKGILRVQIAGVDYTVHAEEAALIFPGQIHAYSKQWQCECRLCIFSPDFLPELRQGYFPVFAVEPGLLKHLLEQKENHFAVRSFLYGVAARYVEGAPYPAKSIKQEALICKVVQYIEEHFIENLSLRKMAAELGYNYRYLSGVVNRCFETSFPRVVSRFRIDLACRLLKTDQYSITEVAERSGFDSLRNFNRCFKEITGKTPREYAHQ